MELVKQHQQDLRTATQFRHGAWRVLTDKVRAVLDDPTPETASATAPVQGAGSLLRPGPGAAAKQRRAE